MVWSVPKSGLLAQTKSGAERPDDARALEKNCEKYLLLNTTGFTHLPKLPKLEKCCFVKSTPFIEWD